MASGNANFIDRPGYCGYIPGIMVRQKRTKTTPVMVHTKPDSILSIQIRYRARDAGGKLGFKGSKAITVSGIGLQEAYDRILKALKE